MTEDPKNAKSEDQSEAKDRPDSDPNQEKKTPPLPKIDFATFIVSLNTSALVHLGILEDPGSGQKTQNLSLAKQTIDILAMLEEKTKGNLTSDEAAMLKSILYDLRILYVKEKK